VRSKKFYFITPVAAVPATERDEGPVVAMDGIVDADAKNVDLAATVAED